MQVRDITRKATAGRYYLEGLAASQLKPRQGRGGPIQPWFYFMHIEKTAGTSLLNSFYQVFPQAAVFPNVYQRRKAYMVHHPQWKDVAQNHTDLFFRDLQMLVGHFGMDPVDHFAIRPQVITFLRDPVDRLLSAIEFNQQPGRRYDQLGLDEILAKHAWREGSLQAQAFGYDPHYKNIDDALANVESADFIGFIESYSDCLSRLSTFMQLPIELRAEHRNSSVRKLQPTDEQRELIDHHTAPDRAVFALARQRHQAASTH